jgi:hypothetical protein
MHPALPDFLEYRPQAPARRTYRIYRTDRGFRIIGDAPVGEAGGRAKDAGTGRTGTSRSGTRSGWRRGSSVGVRSATSATSRSPARLPGASVSRSCVTVVADAAHKISGPAGAPPRDGAAGVRRRRRDVDSAHRYTVDAWAKRYDDVFLIGADQLADLPTWKEPSGCSSGSPRGRSSARLGRSGARTGDRSLRARAAARVVHRDPRARAPRRSIDGLVVPGWPRTSQSDLTAVPDDRFSELQ